MGAFKGEFQDREILICPSHVLLPLTKELSRERDIGVGAQDISIYEKGPYTGEVSGFMIRDYAEYVMVGHSERRGVFLDNNDVVNKKLLMALKSGLKPILCIGETLEEKELGKTEEIVLGQLASGLHSAGIQGVVIAYEPFLAISQGDPTHESASPESVQPIHNMIRKKLAQMFSEELANDTRIIYGGSAKPDNIAGFMAQPDIDGALVGKASRDPESFAAICSTQQ